MKYCDANFETRSLQLEPTHSRTKLTNKHRMKRGEARGTLT